MTATVVAGGGGVQLLTINGYSSNGGAASGVPYLYIFDLNTTTGATAGGDWIMKLPIGDYAGTPAEQYTMNQSWQNASLAKGLTVLLVPAGNDVSLTIEFG